MNTEIKDIHQHELTNKSCEIINNAIKEIIKNIKGTNYNAKVLYESDFSSILSRYFQVQLSSALFDILLKSDEYDFDDLLK